MRIATTMEILRRGALGHTFTDIGRYLHISTGQVRELLIKAGWPDANAITAYRDRYQAGNNRDVWAAADSIASFAKAIRVNEDWVHSATAVLDHQELRALLSIAVAMLDEDVQPREALAWAETGTKRGRPKRGAA